jgi:CBS domain-containing protein
MPSKSRKTQPAVHVVENGMISRIVSIMAHYNASGRSVVAVTIATIDGKTHTFSISLDDEGIEVVKDLARRLMQGGSFPYVDPNWLKPVE